MATQRSKTFSFTVVLTRILSTRAELKMHSLEFYRYFAATKMIHSRLMAAHS
jgi:hypothetical protein